MASVQSILPQLEEASTYVEGQLGLLDEAAVTHVAESLVTSIRKQIVELPSMTVAEATTLGNAVKKDQSPYTN